MKKITRPAALSLWTFDAIRADGSAHHTRGRETQIFEKKCQRAVAVSAYSLFRNPVEGRHSTYNL